MRSILCISHGLYAKEFKESLKMISGPVENLYSCCFLQNDGPAEFTEKLKDTLQQLEKYDEIIVFADLFGGSPCNTAFEALFSDERIKLIAGMNFPMVLTALLCEDVSIEDLIEEGKNGIIDVRHYMSRTNADCDDD